MQDTKLFEKLAKPFDCNLVSHPAALAGIQGFGRIINPAWSTFFFGKHIAMLFL